MIEFHTMPLEDGLEVLIDYRGKTPPKSNFGIPVISAKVVKDGRIVEPIEQKIDHVFYPIWMTRGFPAIGDVVMTTEGPLGEIAQLDDKTSRFALGQRVVCLRGRKGVLDNTFLKFFLMSPKQQEQLRSFSTGTTVSGISQKSLRSLPITIPNYYEQLAISELLGVLDDKIDLNHRINETLESMARVLFKDWFVDFGPTRAKVEGRSPYLAPDLWSLFPDALDDADKPVGWETKDIYSFVEVVYGAPFASSRFNAEQRGLPLIRIRDLANHSPSVYTDEEHPKAQIIEPGDIVVGMDGEFRLHIWKGPTALLNQRVCHLRPKYGISKTFLAEVLQEPLAIFERGKVGTTVIHLGKSDIDTFRLCWPGEQLLTAFGNTADPLIEKSVANSLESHTLAQLRDLLLPKLMSGEIRLKDAETLEEKSL